MDERYLNVNNRFCRYGRKILLGLRTRSLTVLSLFQPGVISSTRSLPFSTAARQTLLFLQGKYDTVKWPLIKMSASPLMAGIDLKTELR